MTDTLPLREQIARIIDGGAWQRHGFTGDPDWHPDDQRLEQRRSLAKADAIMALLPSLPDGWVDFVQGVADARNGEGMFWTTPDRDQDQDVIDRMGDAAVAMLAARPTPPTEPLETER